MAPTPVVDLVAASGKHSEVLLLHINGPLKELLSDLKIFKYNVSVGERFKRINKGDLSLWLMLSNEYIASIPTSSKDSTAQRDSWLGYLCLAVKDMTLGLATTLKRMLGAAFVGKIDSMNYLNNAGKDAWRAKVLEVKSQAPPNLKKQVGHMKDARVKAALLTLNEDPADPNLYPKAKETPSNFPYGPNAKAHRLTRRKKEELVKALRMKDHQWKTLSKETANMLANEGKAEKKLKVALSGSGSSVVKGTSNTGAGGNVRAHSSLVRTTNTPSCAGL
ncbi:uncharacterized protein JCM10292_001709 [Rhodotorula paludigena]|uniref:uncharacterized protein n=1 Tax=Rhodotorula paludigena TaxID=86838 RepID=UPI00317989E4